MDSPLSTLLYHKTLGCLVGGLVGDAMGTPTEGMDYPAIEQKFGWVDTFQGDGTDDTILRDLLIEALIRTNGYATLDDWAQVWLDKWDTIFGSKQTKFFLSVLHTARKLQIQGIPRMAAMGSVPCSSSAMGMAPAGIVNACNPRQAAAQAYNLSSLINVHDAGISQDGAAAIAAAVAEACKADATVNSIVNASTAYLEHISGRRMIDAIHRAIELARQQGDYKAFRAVVYENAGSFFQLRKMNAQETVPITLALFYLAEGKVEQTIAYAVNFGRDADTMAAMGGAISGALHGIEGIRPDWVERCNEQASVSQAVFAEQLVRVAQHKAELEQQAAQALLGLGLVQET